MRTGITFTLSSGDRQRLEALAHLVEPVLEAAHLGGQALVVEQQRGVREPDRHLRHVLHLDQHVDGPVEIGEGAVLGRLRRVPQRRRCQLTQASDARGVRRLGMEDVDGLAQQSPAQAPG